MGAFFIGIMPFSLAGWGILFIKPGVITRASAHMIIVQEFMDE